jgi:hypothetical protein
MVMRILRSWLPLAAAICLLTFLMYLLVQQTLRMGANDPQIQMAEDAARSLASGASVETVLPAGDIDIGTSLAPYWIVFDSNGKPVASDAKLNGQTPSLPDGVFDYVRKHGEDRISWQPQPGVRSAVVIVPVHDSNGGFVLAGRSLREVEIRDTNALNISALGLAGMLFVSLVVTSLVEAIPFFKSSGK